MTEREIMAILQILQRLAPFMSQAEAMFIENVLSRELQKVQVIQLPQVPLTENNDPGTSTET